MYHEISSNNMLLTESNQHTTHIYKAHSLLANSSVWSHRNIVGVSVQNNLFARTNVALDSNFKDICHSFQVTIPRRVEFSFLFAVVSFIQFLLPIRR